MSQEMMRKRPLATGIIGFIVSMLGCMTPALVALLAAVGISGSMGWLDLRAAARDDKPLPR